MNNNFIKKSKHCDIYVIAKKDKKYIIAVGQYQAIEKTFNTIAEAENYIASKPYKLIFNTFQILESYAKKQKETAENTETSPENSESSK